MSVPENLDEFNKMLLHVKLSLEQGLKVFMGCIGGHGRTGLVFAALVKLMSNEEDAITYVRKNYCEKAVESNSQVEWLHKNFGIKKVDGTKGHGMMSKPTHSLYDSPKTPKTFGTQTGSTRTMHSIVPVKVNGHVHGSNLVKNP